MTILPACGTVTHERLLSAAGRTRTYTWTPCAALSRLDFVSSSSVHTEASPSRGFHGFLPGTKNESKNGGCVAAMLLCA